jgi:hypothetical protein
MRHGRTLQILVLDGLLIHTVIRVIVFFICCLSTPFSTKITNVYREDLVNTVISLEMSLVSIAPRQSCPNHP